MTGLCFNQSTGGVRSISYAMTYNEPEHWPQEVSSRIIAGIYFHFGIAAFVGFGIAAFVATFGRKTKNKKFANTLQWGSWQWINTSQVFCCTWNMGEVEPVNDIIHLFDDAGDHISGFSNQGKTAHDIYAIGWYFYCLLCEFIVISFIYSMSYIITFY